MESTKVYNIVGREMKCRKHEECTHEIRANLETKCSSSTFLDEAMKNIYNFNFTLRMYVHQRQGCQPIQPLPCYISWNCATSPRVYTELTFHLLSQEITGIVQVIFKIVYTS